MSVFYQKVGSKALEEYIQNIFNKFDFQPSGKIFIKPNFSGRPPILMGENTSVLILESIVKVLNVRKCEILIGHYPLIASDKKDFTFEHMIEAGGYRVLLKYPNVKLLNLEKVESKTVKIKNYFIKIPKIVHDVDFFINVPKLKTHMETSVSLSIKNLMGLIDFYGKKIFHQHFLNDLLPQLGLHFKPDINILDGIVSMEGNGPHEGTNKNTDIIIAGDDLVEVDSTTAYVMGFNFNNIEHIKKANLLGVGKLPNYEELKKYQKLRFNFIKPNSFMKIGNKIYFWPTTSCSLCHESMRMLKKQLKKNPFFAIKFYYYSLFSKKKINLILGKCEEMSYNKDSVNIFIGVCTKDFAQKNCEQSLNKCPPTAFEIKNYIFNKLKYKKSKK